MACFRPLKAYKAEGGRITFDPTGVSGAVAPLQLKCGQCVGCRIDKTREWALRIMHEAQEHEANSFITLTYDETHIPYDGSVDKSHFQSFMKRLRAKIGPCRFFHCGEYGDETFRPHYHAILFGQDFRKDRTLLHTKKGYPLYVSAALTETWKMGFCTVADVTFDSAAYVARYTIKKATTPNSDDPVVLEDQAATYAEIYRRIDPITGEEYYVKPEYATMSLKPGIGKNWFDRWGDEVFPHDEVIHRGRRFRPPRYYDALYERKNPREHESVKSARRDRVRNSADYTPDRLATRARVATARAKSKKTTL